MFSQENVSVAIKRSENLVVMAFDRDIGYLELPPDQAIAIAEAITNNAFEIDTGLKPVGETLKATLVDRHRDKLIPRINLMLSNKQKSDGLMAKEIIDVVFSEIFT